MLNWAKRFNIFCYLDSQQYDSKEGYECLLAVNAIRYIDSAAPLQQLDEFLSPGHWYFGHLSYDLKDIFYPSLTQEETAIHFPLFYFFEPEILIELKGAELMIDASNPQKIREEIMAEKAEPNDSVRPVHLQERISKQEYTSIIQKLQQHILRGDCYEVNFCQQFFCENAQIDPISIYQKLTELSPTPFSVLYKLHDKYLISASPERFLKKVGNKLLSQPMKGTAPRDRNNKAEDERLKQQLYHDSKERAENVMVVDLVRNDLSKICKEGTVMVDELFGVYSFPQVHQMVSTVSGEINDNTSLSEILSATFPMGSMTGAPKQRVLELIDQYEPVGRGLFSGSAGYIDPAGNFDFNVVIRSILYNSAKNFLAYYVGSGITFYSNAEKEWEECLLKASAIKKVLTL